jgi:hypothetical protein
MAITTSSVAITATGWTLVHTAGSTTPGFQVHSKSRVMFRIGTSAPTAGSAEEGSIIVPALDAHGAPALFDVTIDASDKVYARAESGSGYVTVVA